MDWTKIPDLLAITALVGAFYSILRREPLNNIELSNSPFADSRRWLYGWILILVHFAASMGAQSTSTAGFIARAITLISLVAAAVEFMRASVLNRNYVSSLCMTLAVGVPPSIYIFLLLLPSVSGWMFLVTALFITLGPFMVGLLAPRKLLVAPRYIVMFLYLALGVILLLAGPPHSQDSTLALNAILFTVYLCCCLIFWSSYRGRTSAGSVITIGGFLAWALVFVVGPLFQTKFPAIHIEDEVWNLPKYVVAVGMLLLLLESQIERSQYLAHHDDLTTLANRRMFESHMAECLARCTQSGKTLGLLQIDLDLFKQVNDKHGHHIGDLLLQQVAERMRSRIRRGDLLARTGGDEFSVILTGADSARDIHAVADSLLELLHLPFSVGGHTLRIGASVGTAIYPEDAHDAASLYIAADQRMYQRKELRRSLSS